MASASTAVLSAQQPTMSENNDPKADESSQATAAATSKTSIVTVFDDPNHFTVKHPLMNSWTLWFTKPPTKKENETWHDLLKQVITFNSVEDFWGIYNNFPPASVLPLKADIHLFKAGIRPEWEDVNNKSGGKWSHQILPRQEDTDMDQLWLNVLLGAIGETLENPGDDEVRGAVFSVRKNLCRISLWTGSSGKDHTGGEKRRNILLNVGRNFKKALELKPPVTIGFTAHRDANTRSSKVAPRFTV